MGGDGELERASTYVSGKEIKEMIKRGSDKERERAINSGMSNGEMQRGDQERSQRRTGGTPSGHLATAGGASAELSSPESRERGVGRGEGRVGVEEHIKKRKLDKSVAFKQFLFEPGDWILRRIIDRKKLEVSQHRWHGPYEVLSCNENIVQYRGASGLVCKNPLSASSSLLSYYSYRVSISKIYIFCTTQ